MKRHIQKTGVRKFFGQDFVDLQAEPLKALDAFFAEYGACLIEGCAITEADGGTFNVAPGLVALESTDPDSGVVAVRTMPFAGAQGVALPLYLVAEWTVVERAYGDGKVKPIGYDLSAVASGIAPEGAHLVVTDAGGNRFVDAVQDPAHRFITDAERTKWNDILRQAKEYAVAQAQAEAAASQATAVGLAKAHTDQTVAAVRDELALGDQVAVNTAKAYADRIVAALVDNSPELLNTLEELAGALGGDPEFATTVMQAIGERATNTDLIETLKEYPKADVKGWRVERNCDLMTESGTYDINSNEVAFQNAPFSGYGQVVVFRTRVSFFQMAVSQISASCYFRMKYDYAAWTPWDRLNAYIHPNDANTRHVSDAQMANWNGKANGSHTHGSGDLSGVVVAVTNLTSLDCNLPTFNALQTVNGQKAAIVNGPVSTENLQILTCGKASRFFQIAKDWEGGDLYWRGSVGWQGANTGWQKLYHSGNLKIIRGSVSAEFGTPSGWSGFDANRSSGVVTITHDMGHTQYNVTQALHSNGGTYNGFVIIEKRNNFVKVGVLGPYATYVNCGFDFTIMQY